MVCCNMLLIGRGKFINSKFFSGHPAGGGKLAGFKTHWQTIFQLNAAGQNFKLQRANNADDKSGPETGFKNLRGPFFCKLHQGFFKMLCFHRIACAAALKQFRCKRGDARNPQGFAFGQGISDAQLSVVGNADDIAGPSLFCQFAVRGKKQHRVGNGHRFFSAHMGQLHAAFKMA